MRQSWCDLAFAHWPVPVDVLRPWVPEPLEIQQFEGTSWVGVVPFQMRGVMARGLPPLPWLSAFAELNLRLYVEHQSKPGVWFLSLDAANPIAVWAARRFFFLPYMNAKMSLRSSAGTPSNIEYRSQRTDQPQADFEATYRPLGDVYESQPGTLEHWLTERYCLYAQSASKHLYRAEIQHVPWPLQRGEIQIQTNQLGEAFGIELSAEPHLVHFVKRIDVVNWLPQRLS